MSVDIRPLRPEDRPQWDRLWHAYLAFYDTELPAAQYDLHFARLVDPARPDIAGIVAAAPDGALLGLAHVIRHPHGWKPAGVAYLQDLYVAPGARGTGLGRRLIEELPAWFENHVNGMDAALAFHLDSIGFDFEQGTLKPLAEGEQRGAGCACASMNTSETASTTAAATAA